MIVKANRRNAELTVTRRELAGLLTVIDLARPALPAGFLDNDRRMLATALLAMETGQPFRAYTSVADMGNKDIPT